MLLSRAYLRRITRHPVVVHTKDAKSFAGVLVGVYPDALAIAHARVLSGQGTAVALEGELVIERSNVSFLQAGVTIDDSRTVNT